MSEWIIRKNIFAGWSILHYHAGVNKSSNPNYWLINAEIGYQCKHNLFRCCNKKAPEYLIKLVKLLNFMDKL